MKKPPSVTRPSVSVRWLGGELQIDDGIGSDLGCRHPSSDGEKNRVGPTWHLAAAVEPALVGLAPQHEDCSGREVEESRT